jgi:predicted PurR-regulated permease PerM
LDKTNLDEIKSKTFEALDVENMDELKEKGKEILEDTEFSKDIRFIQDDVEEYEEPDEAKKYYSKPPKISHSPSKIRIYFLRGVTYFLVVAACILLYFLMLRFDKVSQTISGIVKIMEPVIYGFAIAYLLNPIVKRVDKYLVPVLNKTKFKKKAKSISRGIGVAAALLIFIGVIVIFFNLLIPRLYDSVYNLVKTVPSGLNRMMDNLNNIKFDDSVLGSMIKAAIKEGSTSLQKWLKTDLLGRSNEIVANLTSGVISVIKGFSNVLIGMIISIYMLFSKEHFSNQSKKIVYALFKPERSNSILHFSTKTNEIFGGFIIGKIVDSIIIGILCFIIMSIFSMPYAILISVVVGVTNIIPFFGPFIGAIPSALLILIVDWKMAIYFIIMILLLQQFDGNILGPKILGNSTGLSSFWVIVAILLGGGLFGFVGMIIGVPVFALIYYMIEVFINSRLAHKGLPIDTNKYNGDSYVDDEGKYQGK